MSDDIKCPECGRLLIQIKSMFKYYECKHCKIYWEIKTSSKERVNTFLENF